MVTKLVPVEREDRPRLWLVFFGNPDKTYWWARWFLRPGFRHITAAAWYATEQRWIYYNPAGRGTVVAIYQEDEFAPRLAQLISTSTAILRVPSQFARRGGPTGWFCVGAIKSLLGVKSCALSPRGLWRDLLATGAEIVEVPARGGSS